MSPLRFRFTARPAAGISFIRINMMHRASGFRGWISQCQITPSGMNFLYAFPSNPKTQTPQTSTSMSCEPQFSVVWPTCPATRSLKPLALHGRASRTFDLSTPEAFSFRRASGFRGRRNDDAARKTHLHAGRIHAYHCLGRQSGGCGLLGAGGAGHWIKMAGILSPLIIGELVKDNEKRWRWIRIASVATALISEGFHTQRLMQQRREREEERREYQR